MSYTLIITEDKVGIRLDKALQEAFSEFSRSRIQDLINQGHVRLESERNISASSKTILNDVIYLFVPAPQNADPIPQNIPLDIVYEDTDLVVLNKPVGMVVHPANGHASDTLVNALLAHCGNSLSGIGGVRRPGIVHRLDKETSGLMVVAKNDATHHGLSSQFTDRSLSRTYWAFVWGDVIPRAGTIETQIGRHPSNRQKQAVLNSGGRDAVTHYKCLKVFGHSDDPRLRISLIECKLATGRTHQIRVHMNHINHPLIGDPVYGHKPKGADKIWGDGVTKFSRQALHAKIISFIHPTSGEIKTFECDLADDLKGLESMLASLD